MNRSVLASLVPLLVLASAAGAGPYYVRGNFYCHPGVNDPAPGDSCWGWDAGNEMFDDGLHGDGAAGDGVYGAFVVSTQPAGRLEWKVALPDWSEAYPTVPMFPLENAVVFTEGRGDVIHFLFDARFLPGEWQPPFNSVSTDQHLPPGITLEVIGSAPEIGAWTFGVPLAKVGTRWQRFVTIAAPGFYEFKFRAKGTWDIASFGYDYNNRAGRNALLATTIPSSDVFFQFDEPTGRVRALELGPTPARDMTWGRLKALYR